MTPRPLTTAAEARRLLRLARIREAAQDDPKALLAEIKGFDPTLQEYFGFNVPDPETGEWDREAPWAWQSLVVDWWMGKIKKGSQQERDLAEFLGWWEGVDPRSRKFLILKARQLGVTWLAVAVGVWYILFRPGSNVVCYSHGEDEAKLLVQRAWLMLMSLPIELRNHVQVVYPDKAELPSQRIVLKHPDGTYSTFKALPDTQKAGHGETITFCIMDEVARMQYARSIYTAVNPAVARGGRLVMISTANGVSNLETGEGNFFHHLWITRATKGLQTVFLKWSLHPERDDEWYEVEAMALPAMERNQQYPQNPDNAFILSGDLYFDPDALAFYRGQQRRPLARGQFIQTTSGEWEFRQIGGGIIEIFAMPRKGAKYGISADSATGRSQDYSVGHVLDLSSNEVVAKIRGKFDVLTFAKQLKCLGRWYVDEKGYPAKIIPESTGMGEALIQALRSTDGGMMSYPNIYQHTRKSHIDRPISDTLGMPMTTGTRPMVLERLRRWLKDQMFPFLSAGDIEELSTFIYRETNPSPRAMDGCNDDCVMSLALVLQLADLLGDKPEVLAPKVKKKWKQVYKSPVPWKSDSRTALDDYPPLEVERNADGSRKE